MSAIERRRAVLEEVVADPSTGWKERSAALAELAAVEAEEERRARPYVSSVDGLDPEVLARELARVQRPIRAPLVAWQAVVLKAGLERPELEPVLARAIDEVAKARLGPAVAERTAKLRADLDAERAEVRRLRAELADARTARVSSAPAPPTQVTAEVLPAPQDRTDGAERPRLALDPPYRPPARGILGPFPRRGRSIFRDP